MTTITARRPAGADHAVLTVEGAGHRYRRRVCSACPWRRDAIGAFPAEAFRHSANTAREDFTGPDDLHCFGCHTTGSGKPATCAGYILAGAAALSWRLAAARGHFDPALVRSGVLLFGSYRKMAVANGVAPDDPALVGCRT